MTRPRIYGNEANCRRAIARYIKSGEELLDQAEGVQKRMDAIPEDEGRYERYLIEQEWTARLRKWFNTARPGMGQYLQDQYQEVLRVLYWGLPPDTGKPRHWIGLENGVPWLQEALDQLRQLQSALGAEPRRASPAAAAASTTQEKTPWYNNPVFNHPWISGLGTGLILLLFGLLIAR